MYFVNLYTLVYRQGFTIPRTTDARKGRTDYAENLLIRSNIDTMREIQRSHYETRCPLKRGCIEFRNVLKILFQRKSSSSFRCNNNPFTYLVEYEKTVITYTATF